MSSKTVKLAKKEKELEESRDYFHKNAYKLITYPILCMFTLFSFVFLFFYMLPYINATGYMAFTSISELNAACNFTIPFISLNVVILIGYVKCIYFILPVFDKCLYRLGIAIVTLFTRKRGTEKNV